MHSNGGGSEKLKEITADVSCSSLEFSVTGTKVVRVSVKFVSPGKNVPSRCPQFR